MDYKKSKAPVNTVTRNIMDLADETGNIYESVAIIAKRANQISVQINEDLSKKLAEFASYNDNLEEVFENREQIEISRYYEKLPKPTLLATQEFIEHKVYWREMGKDNNGAEAQPNAAAAKNRNESSAAPFDMEVEEADAAQQAADAINATDAVTGENGSEVIAE